MIGSSLASVRFLKCVATVSVYCTQNLYSQLPQFIADGFGSLFQTISQKCVYYIEHVEFTSKKTGRRLMHQSISSRVKTFTTAAQCRTTDFIVKIDIYTVEYARCKTFLWPTSWIRTNRYCKGPTWGTVLPRVDLWCKLTKTAARSSSIPYCWNFACLLCIYLQLVQLLYLKQSYRNIHNYEAANFL